MVTTAVVSLNDKSEVWGHGDERLDGIVLFSRGKFSYSTWRGKSGESTSLIDALADVATQLGYPGGAALAVETSHYGG